MPPLPSPDRSLLAVGAALPAADIERAGEMAGAPRQRWVLGLLPDLGFIIAAPLLCLALAVLAFALLPAAQAATLVLGTHVVLTVAHHLPTWLRLYGDLDSFRAERWRWLVVPLLPFGLALAVLIHLHRQGWALEQFFYLFIVLTLWDPWHFLMQHYGFMRIYDRGNAAPRRLAAAMDRGICTVWMAGLLLASSAWLPELLEDLDRRLGLPLLLMTAAPALAAASSAMGLLALLATLVYAGYLLLCWRRGWFISPAKLALLAISFGVMALAYTPNPMIQALAPGWSFKVGFATVGIVHMTQYLAIVWRYNRNLAARGEGRARAGAFRWLHTRGTLWAAGLYVAACLAYGEALTRDWGVDWLMIPLLALGFTSTLMHYYFDGFLWKLRRPAVATTLAGERGAGGPTTASAPLLSRHLLRPLLLLGLPLALLTVLAARVWAPPMPAYPQALRQAVQAAQAGDAGAAQAAGEAALNTVQQQLPRAAKLAELSPSAARDAQLALLVYSEAWLQQRLLPTLAGHPPGRPQWQVQQAAIDRAIAMLEQALQRGGPLAHPGHEDLDDRRARQLLDGWRGERARLESLINQENLP